MGTKHTAGSWATRGWSITGPTAAVDYMVVEAAKERTPEVFTRTVAQAAGVGKAAVCTAYGMSAEEAQANACLLAAAPDLLEALRALLTAVGRITTEYPTGYDGEKAEALASDAIAKATGSAA